MIIHSIILATLISISFSYWNKIRFKKSIFSHFIDITILSIVFYLITAFSKENLLFLFLGYILFIYYLYYIRLKIFLALSKKTRITDLENIYKEYLNQHIKIYSTNFLKEFKFYFDNDFIYINDSLLNLEKREIVYLLNFFKQFETKKTLLLTCFSLIPFIFFYLANIYVAFKDSLNVVGGISFFFIQNFDNYFIGIFKLKNFDITNKSNLIESLNSYKKLIQKDKYNATNKYRIQKIIDEINNL